MIAGLHAVEGERVQVREPRFRLVPFDEVRPGREPAYLVKRLIPRVGLIVVWGPPKSGKSFWTFDFMMHVISRHYASEVAGSCLIGLISLGGHFPIMSAA